MGQGGQSDWMGGPVRRVERSQHSYLPRTLHVVKSQETPFYIDSFDCTSPQLQEGIPRHPFDHLVILGDWS